MALFIIYGWESEVRFFSSLNISFEGNHHIYQIK